MVHTVKNEMCCCSCHRIAQAILSSAVADLPIPHVTDWRLAPQAHRALPQLIGAIATSGNGSLACSSGHEACASSPSFNSMWDLNPNSSLENKTKGQGSHGHASPTLSPFVADADRAPPAGRDRRYKRRSDFQDGGAIIEY
ncbi:hypothetical protein EVAR_101066_1 [Eumeta japonica]|uniref:Uncharacterized protein n=1 Tax=Eumeta variegata TaxID=151549 RepID=A0A4C1SHH8_EUMVA|nr:hypothetical protein EVAR_101066_1 [Eumeta japonica]